MDARHGIRMRVLVRAARAAGIALVLSAGPGAAARLEVRGAGVTRGEVEAMARDALRAPGDSVRVRRLLGRVIETLQGRGYLDARAEGRWETAGEPVLAVEIDAGEVRRLATVELRFAAGSDSAVFAPSLDLAPGDPAAPSAVSAAIARAVDDAVAGGHPYAALGVTAWDDGPDGVRLGIGGTAGPQVIVDDVRIEGLRVTRPALARRVMGPLGGLPYNPAAAEEARERLAGLGLFRRVSYEGLEGETDWNRGRLVYRVEEPAYNRFDGVVGTSRDGGTVGRAQVDLDNLLGTGRAAGVQWESRGHGVTTFGARYAEPLVFGTPLRLEASVTQQVQDTLFVRTRWGGRGRVALSAREGVEAGYEAERIVQDEGIVEEASVQRTVFALDRTAVDDRRLPRRGSVVRLDAAHNFKIERLRPEGRRKARASEVDLRGTVYRPAGAGSGWSVEARAWGRFSSERVLPFYDREPLGGSATLRGHEEEAFRVDRFALTRSEWSWFPEGGHRVFLFWDHAWMETRLEDGNGIGTHLDARQADGYGFGLRLAVPAGRIGVDFGWAPGDGPLDGKVHLRMESTF